MKTKLIVSRKWHQPQIETFLSNEEVGASMELTDFIQALSEHIGNPTLLITKGALAQKLQQASDAVLDEIRRATIHIV
jgi:hypothetical protein